jgi:hypothetical protein
MVVKIHQGSLAFGQQCHTGSNGHCDSPTEGFIRPSVFEEIVDVMEVGKIGIYFHDPVRLHKYDRTDEDPARILGKEWFDLHPGDDVV